MTCKRMIKRAKKNSMDLQRLVQIYIKMKILINGLDFIPSPFLVCFSSIGLSPHPPLPKKNKEKGKQGNGS
jgi:hypothetical protein